MRNNLYESAQVPQVTQCKICDGLAKLTGVVDFSRCGLDTAAGRKVEGYAGWPIYYHRCMGCGFTFTRAFDSWTTSDFGKHIYNDDYARHDPAYLGSRPEENSRTIDGSFGRHKEETTILDYGSGLGLLEKKLIDLGFPSVRSYDPFSDTPRPMGSFNMITVFEVFEHVVDPLELVSDLKSFLDGNGAIFFSTMFCTQEIIDQGLSNWWYCVPRNGHISFFTPHSLDILASRMNLHRHSFNDGFHVFYGDTLPSWLKHHGLEPEKV